MAHSLALKVVAEGVENEAQLAFLKARQCDEVHGTDTLAYSAAAMCFQLVGLPAPVLFTGSMLPAGVPNSDAWENVSGALSALAQGQPNGVQLYFHGALLAPTRCAKVRSFGRNPFVALKRNGGAAKADALPGELMYRQPKHEASVGVLPLVPGIAPHSSMRCSTAG